MAGRRKLAKTFVVAHGAWVGAWAWMRVSERLASKGHRVFVPTLSGLGERSHLARWPVNLTTHVNDVVNEIRWKDLEDVVLVGHSYGGFVITGVAERLVDRIRTLAYVEAFIPKDGQSFSDLATDWEVEESLVPSPPTQTGDYIREADRHWVDSKATAQPTATFTEKIHVTGAYRSVKKKLFVRATSSTAPFDELTTELRSDGSFRVRELACGHDIPVDMPDELASILDAEG